MPNKFWGDDDTNRPGLRLLRRRLGALRGPYGSPPRPRLAELRGACRAGRIDCAVAGAGAATRGARGREHPAVPGGLPRRTRRRPPAADPARGRGRRGRPRRGLRSGRGHHLGGADSPGAGAARGHRPLAAPRAGTAAEHLRLHRLPQAGPAFRCRGPGQRGGHRRIPRPAPRRRSGNDASAVVLLRHVGGQQPPFRGGNDRTDRAFRGRPVLLGTHGLPGR